MMTVSLVMGCCCWFSTSQLQFTRPQLLWLFHGTTILQLKALLTSQVVLRLCLSLNIIIAVFELLYDMAAYFHMLFDLLCVNCSYNLDWIFSHNLRLQIDRVVTNSFHDHDKHTLHNSFFVKWQCRLHPLMHSRLHCWHKGICYDVILVCVCLTDLMALDRLLDLFAHRVQIIFCFSYPYMRQTKLATGQLSVQLLGAQ